MVETVSFLNFLETIGVLATLIFVLTSMLGMGFSLTVQQILIPLRNRKLVIFSLAANFVLVPLLALGVLFIFPLSEGLSIGFFLLGTSAGAPFLPKLTQVAKGDTAFAVGLMVLLMVVTIIYVPIVLPLFLSGVTIDPWDIAKSLILLMLFPLAIALFIRARYEEVANGLLPLMTQATNLSLLVLFVAFFVVYFSDLVNVIGTTAVMATVVFLLVSFVIGYFLGGPSRSIRRVLALGTAQRNLSAALAISTLNFTDPDVMVMILVVALAGLVLLMFIGGELGKRAEVPASHSFVAAENLSKNSGGRHR
jgi:predicted Na+-dependent transporter